MAELSDTRYQYGGVVEQLENLVGAAGTDLISQESADYFKKIQRLQYQEQLVGTDVFKEMGCTLRGTGKKLCESNQRQLEIRNKEPTTGKFSSKGNTFLDDDVKTPSSTSM